MELPGALTLRPLLHSPIDDAIAAVVTYADALPVPSPTGRNAQRRLESLRDRAILQTLYATALRRQELARLDRLGGEPWAHGSLALFYAFNDAIAAVARAESCLFVDLLAASGETHWVVHNDGVHQNDLGHRLVANRVFEVLAQNCSGLARRTKQAELTSPRWRDESTLRADYGY